MAWNSRHALGFSKRIPFSAARSASERDWPDTTRFLSTRRHSVAKNSRACWETTDTLPASRSATS